MHEWWLLCGVKWNNSVADPGFPIGGADPSGEVPTSDAVAFWWKCMWKEKNWVPLGGGCSAPAAPCGSMNAFSYAWMDYITTYHDLIRLLGSSLTSFPHPRISVRQTQYTIAPARLDKKVQFSSEVMTGITMEHLPELNSVIVYLVSFNSSIELSNYYRKVSEMLGSKFRENESQTCWNLQDNRVITVRRWQ